MPVKAVVSVLQSCAVAALCGKAYLERPKEDKDEAHDNAAAARGSEQHTDQERIELQDQLDAVVRDLRRAKTLDQTFQRVYREWKKARIESLQLLRRALRKIKRLETRINMADCAGGTLGATGGCLTLIGLLLSLASGGISGILMAAGLGVEGAGTVFTFVEAALRLCSGRIVAPKRKAVLERDRQFTERLGHVCADLCDVCHLLKHDSCSFLRGLRQYRDGDHAAPLRFWPLERAMELLCVSTEVVCALPVVAIEAFGHHALGSSAHVATHVAHSATTSTMATTASRVVSQHQPATRKMLREGAQKLGETFAKHRSFRAPITAAAAEVADSAASLAKSGVHTAPSWSIVEHSTSAAGRKFVTSADAIAVAPAVSSGSHITFSLVELFGAGLTVCGIGLELLSAVRAARRIRHGTTHDLEESLQHAFKSLYDNYMHYVAFQTAYMAMIQTVCATTASNPAFEQADVCFTQPFDVVMPIDNKLKPNYNSGGGGDVPTSCFCSNSTAASHLDDEEDKYRFLPDDDDNDNDNEQERHNRCSELTAVIEQSSTSEPLVPANVITVPYLLTDGNNQQRFVLPSGNEQKLDDQRFTIDDHLNLMMQRRSSSVRYCSYCGGQESTLNEAQDVNNANDVDWKSPTVLHPAYQRPRILNHAEATRSRRCLSRWIHTFCYSFFSQTNNISHHRKDIAAQRWVYR